MKTAMRTRTFAVAAVLAAVACFAVALAAFGSSMPGYSQSTHAVDVLGAIGVPGAGWFNALAFVFAGLLVAMVGLVRWLGQPGAPAAARIGALIAVFSALAFVVLGMFPLDLYRLDARSTRVHALAWSLWWLSIATGALLEFVARPLGRPWPRGAIQLALAWAVPAFALFAPLQWGSAIPQRLAFAAWFAWWLLAAATLSRSATSVPGSLPRAAA
ncbi:MAG: DUF998 domain-containing protein [Luteimonas sp.]